MSAYKGHRGPNVSQYIANLNQLSPEEETLNEPLPLEDDFSAFLNTDFFDVRNGPVVDFPSSPIDLAAEQSPRPDLGKPSRKRSSQASAEPTMDFNLNSDFAFTDFSNNFGAGPILDPSLHGLPQSGPHHYPLPTTYGSPTSDLSPTSGFEQGAKKRKTDTATPITQQSLDESARNAAEEDKRRRNTAASARFRVKKKQREQALEKTSKEMLDKATRLEQKVQQLETENAWLKSLITEKSGMHSSTDLKALLSKREEAAAGRSSPAHTDGVGTDA